MGCYVELVDYESEWELDHSVGNEQKLSTSDDRKRAVEYIPTHIGFCEVVDLQRREDPIVDGDSCDDLLHDGRNSHGMSRPHPHKLATGINWQREERREWRCGFRETER